MLYVSKMWYVSEIGLKTELRIGLKGIYFCLYTGKNILCNIIAHECLIIFIPSKLSFILTINTRFMYFTY